MFYKATTTDNQPILINLDNVYFIFGLEGGKLRIIFSNPDNYITINSTFEEFSGNIHENPVEGV